MKGCRELIGIFSVLALMGCADGGTVASQEAALAAAEPGVDELHASPQEDVEPDLQSVRGGPITNMTCASLDKLWNSVPEQEIAYYICTYPTGTCAPVYVTVNEFVECENSCSNPTAFVCFAYPPAPYSIHLVPYPSVPADSTCQIPCNSRNPCNRCT
jgi:hypothetical protein